MMNCRCDVGLSLRGFDLRRSMVCVLQVTQILCSTERYHTRFSLYKMGSRPLRRSTHRSSTINLRRPTHRSSTIGHRSSTIDLRPSNFEHRSSKIEGENIAPTIQHRTENSSPNIVHSPGEYTLRMTARRFRIL